MKKVFKVVDKAMTGMFFLVVIPVAALGSPLAVFAFTNPIMRFEWLAYCACMILAISCWYINVATRGRIEHRLNPVAVPASFAATMFLGLTGLDYWYLM